MLLQRLNDKTYQGQRLHKCVDVSHASGFNDLIHGDLATVITVLNVLTNAAVKQNWLLRDESDL